jgi:hypothetical protein
MLLQYHNEVGNKWSLIAQKIPGKYVVFKIELIIA